MSYADGVTRSVEMFSRIIHQIKSLQVIGDWCWFR